MASLFNPSGLAATTKRKAYFAFHYDDIMRVNNVRQAWKIDHPDNALYRSFYDSSLWESKKLTDPEQIKRLIREGVEYTSSVCVLVGTATWQRRWLKYEIARAVVDKRGLLAVHLNGLKHHQLQIVHDRGYNPIQLMGVALHPNGNNYLCEWALRDGQWKWIWYEDYVQAVALPPYVRQPVANQPLSLSRVTREYDFAAQQGHKNIGGWIDLAAQEAGR